MIHCYKTIDNRLQEIPTLEKGCWVSVIAPSEEEVTYLVEELCIDQDFVRAALDDEESSRIENEDGQILVIVDVPTSDRQDDSSAQYSTMPMGIILAGDYVVTICLRSNQVITEMTDGGVKNLTPHLKTRFLFVLLLRIASRFLLYLKQIDKLSSYTEQQMHKSMRNKELFQLLGLEKSLIYFSTSLRSNEITLEKIMRGRTIKLYEEDEEILEDVLIEIKQAIEMCNIYSNILSGTMGAFGSIISNNLSIVMKTLTSLTIVMAIPTMVSGFYGMNVSGLPMPYFWFPAIVAGVLMLIIGFILFKKNLFR